MRKGPVNSRRLKLLGEGWHHLVWQRSWAPPGPDFPAEVCSQPFGDGCDSVCEFGQFPVFLCQEADGKVTCPGSGITFLHLPRLFSVQDPADPRASDTQQPASIF